MKKQGIFFVVVNIMLFVIATSFYPGQHRNSDDIIIQDTLIKYRDGSYVGQSQDTYSEEPYWGKARITVKNGLVTRVNFTIRDSNLHETFNSKYKKHFEGNEEYIQQCKNDWKGVKTYPKKLLKIQDINKVDATSGATWSHNIFRASVNEALKKAVDH
jgi:major membrane immunogen (membrane-anchored lipoprotein)